MEYRIILEVALPINMHIGYKVGDQGLNIGKHYDPEMAQAQVYDILDNTKATTKSKRDVCTTMFQCDNRGKSEDKKQGKTADSNVLITNHKWRERAGQKSFYHPPLQDLFNANGAGLT